MTFPKTLDYSNMLGMAASGLCAIHCTLTPILFAAKPLLEGAVHADGHAHVHSIAWALFDYAFLLLSLFAVWYTVRHSNERSTRVWLWVAWAVFAIGILSEPFHIPYGKVLMYGGSIALVVLHLRNYQYCKKCRSETCSMEEA